MFPFIHIAKFELPTYGLMALLGIIVCVLFLFNRRKYAPIEQDDLLHSILFAVIGAMVGGKILYWLTIIPYIMVDYTLFFSSIEQISDFFTQGFVFYGGLFGALLLIKLYCSMYGVSFYQMMQLASPAFPLFHFFGRIGCFFMGCCYGIQVPWGFAFDYAVGAPNHIPLLPVQLVESGFNLCLFFGLYWMQKRKKKWNLLRIYLLSYAVGRFILEFLRGDQMRGVYLGISTSQWISLLIIISVCLHSFLKLKNAQRKGFE